MSSVVFDVDGVLADFHLGYAEKFREVTGSMFPLTRGQVSAWNDLGDDRVWATIKKDTTFWERLVPLAPWKTYGRINMLADQHDVYFVTARIGKYPKAQTERWLTNMGIETPTVVCTNRKAEFATAVKIGYAIDDRADLAIAVAAVSRGTKSYILDAPYNKLNHGILGSTLTRVETVDEFVDAVEAG